MSCEKLRNILCEVIKLTILRLYNMHFKYDNSYFIDIGKKQLLITYPGLTGHYCYENTAFGLVTIFQYNLHSVKYTHLKCKI